MTEAERSTLAAALYVALRRYQRGDYARAMTAVGTLPVDLSQVLIAVEKEMEGLK